MEDPTGPYFLLFFFPVFFVVLWLAVTTLIGFMSGWFALMARYPDRNETPLVRLSGQTGYMRWGSRMRGVLTLSACSSGLRVGIWKIFGAFARDFFVPWEDIRVRRTDWMFARMTELEFGEPKVGSLTIAATVADRLAQAAGDEWPEEEAPPL